MEFRDWIGCDVDALGFRVRAKPHLLNWTGDRCRVSTRHEVLHSYYRSYYTRESEGDILPEKQREEVESQSPENKTSNQERAQYPSPSVHLSGPITLHDSDGSWRGSR